MSFWQKLRSKFLSSPKQAEIPASNWSELLKKQVEPAELREGMIYSLAILNTAKVSVYKNMKAIAFDFRSEVMVAHLEDPAAQVVFSFLDLNKYGITWCCLPNEL